MELKGSKTRIGMKYKTATSTPAHKASPSLFDSFDLRLD
jgi:hypothetical protein